jgi:hypothetical protein
MPLTPELLELYLATRYTAATPGGEVVIRIGQRHAAVDLLLERLGERSCAYLTACNPRSRALDPEQNRARQAALASELEGRYTCFEGEGVAADGSWREPSLLVIGISRGEANRLAEHWGQNAFVWGEIGGAAELILCDPSPPSACSR